MSLIEGEREVDDELEGQVEQMFIETAEPDAEASFTDALEDAIEEEGGSLPAEEEAPEEPLAGPTLDEQQLRLESMASQQDRYFNSPQFFNLQATNPELAQQQVQQASGERSQMMQQHKQVLGKRVQAGLESTFTDKAEFSQMVDHYRRSGVPLETIRQGLMQGEGQAMCDHWKGSQRDPAVSLKGGKPLRQPKGLLDVDKAFSDAKKQGGSVGDQAAAALRALGNPL